jgi:hypothetical protein
VRTNPAGERQILTVPLHKELATGTLYGIYRRASRFIDPAKLRPHFFTEQAYGEGRDYDSQTR